MAKFKRLKIGDLLSPFIFLVIYPLAFFYKKILNKQNRKIILIIEDPMEACDNGYSYFLYLNKNCIPDVYYVIAPTSPHFIKFKGYEDSVIYYKSFKHWLFYLSAFRNYSIHKAGSPSPALFYILHKYRLFSGNRVFLQHGIIMNDLPYLYKNECNFDYFITSSIREKQFIIENFGYSDDEVLLTGLSRFDTLLESQESNGTIAILPTWRSYLMFSDEKEFKESEYYLNWKEAINNIRNRKYSSNNDIIFYIHRNFIKFSYLFVADGVKVLTREDKDLNEIITTSSMLVTDYSSISFDFAYQRKPILYFQFDLENFRQNHLEEGYFSYKKDGFGPVVFTQIDLIKEFDYILKNNCIMEKKYQNRVIDFFRYVDANNSKRIYEMTLKRELSTDVK